MNRLGLENGLLMFFAEIALASPRTGVGNGPPPVSRGRLLSQSQRQASGVSMMACLWGSWHNRYIYIYVCIHIYISMYTYI